MPRSIPDWKSRTAFPCLKTVILRLYKNVIDNIKYDYSSEDTTKMNDEAVKLSAMTESIINEFKDTDLYDPSQKAATISSIMEKITEKTARNYMNLDTLKYFSICKFYAIY